MFSYETKVRYSEVDTKKKLKIPELVNYLQDVCVFHSEAVGAGLDYTEAVGRVWMLGAWRIEFLEDIYFMDDIKLSTWPNGFKAFMGTRSFMIEKAGKVCVKADSSWMLYSIKEGRLVKAVDEDTKFYPCEPPLDMERCKRKLEKKGNLTGVKEFVIPTSYIDTNGHVNNGKYVQMAIDSVKPDGKISVLEAEYKMAAKLGDKVFCHVFTDENEVFVEMKNDEDIVYAQVKFTLK